MCAVGYKGLASGEPLLAAGFGAVVEAAEPLGAPFVAPLAGPPPAGW